MGHKLQEEGLFKPGFENLGDSDAEQDEEPSPASAEEQQAPELNNEAKRKSFKQERIDLNSINDDDEKDEGYPTGSSASASKAAEELTVAPTSVSSFSRREDLPVRLARTPRGAAAHIAPDGLTVTRQDPNKSGTTRRQLDEIGSAIQEQGLDSKTGRKMFYHVRRKLGDVQDDGCTVISELPIRRIPGIGQYAEVVVLETRQGAPLGCVGLGITLLDPMSWFPAKEKPIPFPRRLDKFPGPSWIFSGPYAGITRRLYVDGNKSVRYFPEEFNARYQDKDRVGILVGLDGSLSLYINDRHAVCIETPEGMAKVDASRAAFYVVAEAYGYVQSIALQSDAYPPGSGPTAPMQSLDDFLA